MVETRGATQLSKTNFSGGGTRRGEGGLEGLRGLNIDTGWSCVFCGTARGLRAVSGEGMGDVALQIPDYWTRRVSGLFCLPPLSLTLLISNELFFLVYCLRRGFVSGEGVGGK